MNRCIIYVLLFACLSVWVQGLTQGGYNITYSDSLFGSMHFDHLILSNDTLTVMGTYNDDSLQVAGVIVAQFDTTGRYLRSTLVVDSTRSSHLITGYNDAFIRTRDNGFAIPAVAFNRNNPMLIRLDVHLEVIGIYEFEHTDLQMSSAHIIELGSGYLLLGDIQRSNYNNMIFALRIDGQGNELWRKFYGDVRYDSYFGAAVRLDDNKIAIGSSFSFPTDHFTPLEDEWSKPWIFAIDTNGTKQWEWIGQEHDGLGWDARNLRRTSDGQWIFTPNQRHLVEVYPTIFENQYTPVLVRLDSFFDIVWEQDYEKGPRAAFNFFYDAHVTEDDQFILVGQRGQSIGQGGYIAGRVVKTNYEGVQTWEVIDTGIWGQIGSWNFLTGVAVSASGSIYCSGYTDPLNAKTLGWLIKVTADGCIDTLCTTTALKDIADVNDLPRVKIYPNPTSELLTVEFREPFRGISQFILFDMYGREVYAARLGGTRTTLPVTDADPPLVRTSISFLMIAERY
jgi:hypothetical protein